MVNSSIELAGLVQPNDGTTVGVELETHLYDRETFRIVPDGGSRFLAEYENYSDRWVSGFTSESKASMVEVNSQTIHPSDLPKAIGQMRRSVYVLGARHGLVPVFSGMPLNGADTLPVSGGPAYQSFLLPYPAEMPRNDTAGVHVHVGIDNESVRVDTYNRLRAFLPVLVAYSAGSAINRGQISHAANSRTLTYDMFETAVPDPGPFDSLDDWTQWCKTKVADARVSADDYPLEKLLTDPAPGFEKKTAVNLVYPLMRMHPKYPTIEFRMPAVGLSPQDDLFIASVVTGITRQVVTDIANGVAKPAIPDDLNADLLRAKVGGGLSQVRDPFDMRRYVSAEVAMAKTVEHIASALVSVGIPFAEVREMHDAIRTRGHCRDRSVFAVTNSAESSESAARFMRGDMLSDVDALVATRAIHRANLTSTLSEGRWSKAAMPPVGICADMSPDIGSSQAAGLEG